MPWREMPGPTEPDDDGYWDAGGRALAYGFVLALTFWVLIVALALLLQAIT